jgi:hypothetical protein
VRAQRIVETIGQASRMRSKELVQAESLFGISRLSSPFPLAHAPLCFAKVVSGDSIM